MHESFLLALLTMLGCCLCIAADVMGVRATSGDSGGRGMTVCRLCESGGCLPLAQLLLVCTSGHQCSPCRSLRHQCGSACVRHLSTCCGSWDVAPQACSQSLSQSHSCTAKSAAPPSAGKYVERVALPYVFKYLVSELAAMNIRCSLDVK